MSDPTKINKTIKELRKENCKDKVFRELRFLLDPEKDHYEPKKQLMAFTNNYIQYNRIGDKDKSSWIR